MEKRFDRRLELMVVFILLNSFGFPGNYTRAFGAMLGTLVEYTSFLFQILIMVLSAGDTVMDLKLIDLKKKYTSIYIFLAVVFAVSMLGTRSRSENAVTCIRLCTTVLFALWMAENLSVEDILRLTYYAQILFILANLGFVTLFSRYVYRESAAYSKDFVGVFSAKNGAGTEFSFGIMMQCLMWRVYSDAGRSLPRFFFPVLFVQIALVLMTHNVGAMLSVSGSIVYGCFLEKRTGGRRLPLGYLYVAGSVGFLFLALTILPVFTPLLESLGKDATLTGRIPLWRQVIAVMQEHHTLIGYGYGMFWRDPDAVALIHAGFDRYSFMGNMTSGSHNAVLELWLNIGLIGTGALFYTVVDSFRHIRRLREEQYLFCSVFIIMFTVYGFSERSYSPYEYQTVFMFISLGLANSWEPVRERTAPLRRYAPRAEDRREEERTPLWRGKTNT